jgi:hypothetical protein
MTYIDEIRGKDLMRMSIVAWKEREEEAWFFLSGCCSSGQGDLRSLAGDLPPRKKKGAELITNDSP